MNNPLKSRKSGVASVSAKPMRIRWSMLKFKHKHRKMVVKIYGKGYASNRTKLTGLVSSFATIDLLILSPSMVTVPHDRRIDGSNTI